MTCCVFISVHVLDDEAAAGPPHSDGMQRESRGSDGVWNNQWRGETPASGRMEGMRIFQIYLEFRIFYLPDY